MMTKQTNISTDYIIYAEMKGWAHPDPARSAEDPETAMGFTLDSAMDYAENYAFSCQIFARTRRTTIKSVTVKIKNP